MYEGGGRMPFSVRELISNKIMLLGNHLDDNALPTISCSLSGSSLNNLLKSPHFVL